MPFELTSLSLSLCDAGHKSPRSETTGTFGSTLQKVYEHTWFLYQNLRGAEVPASSHNQEGSSERKSQEHRDLSAEWNRAFGNYNKKAQNIQETFRVAKACIENKGKKPLTA